jgi:excisionase family DNA binding protein
MMLQENALGARVRPIAEKISIVRRRSQNNENDFAWGNGLQVKLENHPGGQNMLHNLDDTTGDSKFIPLGSLEQESLKVLRGISIERPEIETGRIVFNFRLKTDDTLKLLTMDQVGQMLQVSKSFLIRLVKGKKIRSYKFGRLRRFLLTDVVDYLSLSEDQVPVKKKIKGNGNGLISKLDR